MPGRKRRALPADLSRAAERFKQWRRTRGRGERIPARLWSLAAAVARRHGVSRTAGVLKLEYYALKERLTQPSPSGDAAGSAILPPSFVELAPGPFPLPSPCEIEFSDAFGSTLRIRLPAGHVPDLVALVRSCRESR
jgi:hypothetical protein